MIHQSFQVADLGNAVVPVPPPAILMVFLWLGVVNIPYSKEKHQREEQVLIRFLHLERESEVYSISVSRIGE